MEFYINQCSSQPLLIMKLNKDGGMDYLNFQIGLENSSITFSMIDVQTGIYKIANKAGGILLKDKLVTPDEPNAYYIYYKFTTGDTKTVGRYKAEFQINLYDVSGTTSTGIFKAPIAEQLYINVLESINKVNLQRPS